GRLSWSRAGGLLLGIAGVAVLASGDSPVEEGVWPLLGCLAVVLASASYAVGALYARLAFAGEASLAPAAAQNVAGAVLTIPFALFWARPEHLPPLQAGGSVLLLGVLGTALAYLI